MTDEGIGMTAFSDAELRAYAAALQRAIEHHCRGLLVPDDIAQECPLHAKKLNGALYVEARRDARRYQFWRDRGFCNQTLEDMLACAETADDFDALLDGWIDNAMLEGK